MSAIIRSSSLMRLWMTRSQSPKNPAVFQSPDENDELISLYPIYLENYPVEIITINYYYYYFYYYYYILGMLSLAIMLRD